MAASTKGLKVIICMSLSVPKLKVDSIKSLGAEVRQLGLSQLEAEIECQRLVEEEGFIEVSPFDDPFVISGQGTIGLELLRQRPDIKSVIVPLSGGGLAGGLAVAIKEINPQVQIIGVTMENGAAMNQSIKLGKPTEVLEQPTLADALAGGIGLHNRFSFSLCSELLDDTITVSEMEIYNAIQCLYYEDRIITEGACAVGVAAVLSNRLKLVDGPVVSIITGQNVDMTMFTDIINGRDIRLGTSKLSGKIYEKIKYIGKLSDATE